MLGYIKEGITIGGITGTLETLNTFDATARPEDIVEGKTAYVKGEKITGTYSDIIHVETIEVDMEDGTFIQGESHQYKAYVYPENAINKNVIWSSSNTDVAIVDQNGLTVCRNVGNTMIRATSKENENIYDEVSLRVTAKPAVPGE